jgi:hypothetical protein
MITSVQVMSSANITRIEKKTTNIPTVSYFVPKQILFQLPLRKNGNKELRVPAAQLLNPEVISILVQCGIWKLRAIANLSSLHYYGRVSSFLM